MEIIAAQVTDMEIIYCLLEKCGRYLFESGIDQWQPSLDYPNRNDVTQDIAAQTLFVAKTDADVQGVITLNQDQPPEYVPVAWQCNRQPILVVHRLAVDPGCHQQGIGSYLMEFAQEYALRKGFAAIRLDAYSHNPRSLRLYQKCGYQNVGTIRFPGRQYPFYCFEKILEQR